jgi:hypothetical protein
MLHFHSGQVYSASANTVVEPCKGLSGTGGFLLMKQSINSNSAAPVLTFISFHSIFFYLSRII